MNAFTKSGSTCTHHPDSERTACPVCLVAALTAERDQLRVALAAERARLDWLEKRGPWESWVQHASERSILLRAPIRDAIDAAMKEDAK